MATSQSQLQFLNPVAGFTKVPQPMDLVGIDGIQRGTNAFQGKLRSETMFMFPEQLRGNIMKVFSDALVMLMVGDNPWTVDITGPHIVQTEALEVQTSLVVYEPFLLTSNTEAEHAREITMHKLTSHAYLHRVGGGFSMYHDDMNTAAGRLETLAKLQFLADSARETENQEVISHIHNMSGQAILYHELSLGRLQKQNWVDIMQHSLEMFDILHQERGLDTLVKYVDEQMEQYQHVAPGDLNAILMTRECVYAAYTQAIEYKEYYRSGGKLAQLLREGREKEIATTIQGKRVYQIHNYVDNTYGLKPFVNRVTFGEYYKVDAWKRGYDDNYDDFTNDEYKVRGYFHGQGERDISIMDCLRHSGFFNTGPGGNHQVALPLEGNPTKKDMGYSEGKHLFLDSNGSPRETVGELLSVNDNMGAISDMAATFLAAGDKARQVLPLPSVAAYEAAFKAEKRRLTRLDAADSNAGTQTFAGAGAAAKEITTEYAQSIPESWLNPRLDAAGKKIVREQISYQILFDIPYLRGVAGAVPRRVYYSKETPFAFTAEQAVALTDYVKTFIPDKGERGRYATIAAITGANEVAAAKAAVFEALRATKYAAATPMPALHTETNAAIDVAAVLFSANAALPAYVAALIKQKVFELLTVGQTDFDKLYAIRKDLNALTLVVEAANVAKPEAAINPMVATLKKLGTKLGALQAPAMQAAAKSLKVWARTPTWRTGVAMVRRFQEDTGGPLGTTTTLVATNALGKAPPGRPAVDLQRQRVFIAQETALAPVVQPPVPVMLMDVLGNNAMLRLQQDMFARGRPAGGALQALVESALLAHDPGDLEFWEGLYNANVTLPFGGLACKMAVEVETHSVVMMGSGGRCVRFAKHPPQFYPIYKGFFYNFTMAKYMAAFTVDTAPFFSTPVALVTGVGEGSDSNVWINYEAVRKVEEFQWTDSTSIPAARRVGRGWEPWDGARGSLAATVLPRNVLRDGITGTIYLAGGNALAWNYRKQERTPSQWSAEQYEPFLKPMAAVYGINFKDVQDRLQEHLRTQPVGLILAFPRFEMHPAHASQLDYQRKAAAGRLWFLSNETTWYRGTVGGNCDQVRTKSILPGRYDWKMPADDQLWTP